MVFFPRKSYFLCFGDLRTVFLLDPSSAACASRERGTVQLPGAPGAATCQPAWRELPSPKSGLPFREDLASAQMLPVGPCPCPLTCGMFPPETALGATGGQWVAEVRRGDSLPVNVIRCQALAVRSYWVHASSSMVLPSVTLSCIRLLILP